MAQYNPWKCGDNNRYDYRHDEAEAVFLESVYEVHAEERGDERRQHHDDRHGGERTHHGVHVVVDDGRVGVHRRLEDVRIDVRGLTCLRHLDVYVLDKVGVQLVHLQLELQFGKQRLVASDGCHEVRGGLDGRFFAHMEEIDLCWRLRTRGRDIVCVPNSVAYHVGGGTLDAGNPRKTFLNFRNNLFMLYKNLPQDELTPVMRTRTLLDWVAAIKFWATGDIKNFKAVMKARKEFKQRCHEFFPDRQRNLQLAVNGGKNIAERIPQSILWLYYIKGIKKFSQLK